MRILFSFVGGAGHAEPMVPIAQAMQAAGHVVVFAGHARYLPALVARGLATVAVDGSAVPAPSQRLPLVQPSQDNEDRVLRDHYAGAVARRRATRYAQLYDEWQPDVVVRDEMDFGAAVLTERRGLPHAVVLVLAAGSFVRPDVIAEPLDALRADHGLLPDPDLGTLHRGLVLSPFPAGFRDPAFPLPTQAHSYRLPQRGPGERLPQWCQRLTARPVVYLTLGTVFPLESGDLFGRLLAGLAQLPLEIIATVGRDIDPAELGDQPEHVHVEQWLPQSLVLPQTDLVISHGGSGTVTAALAHGLPQIVVAMGADQLLNAARVETLGLGHSLHPVTMTPTDIRDATADLLTDTSARAAAQRLQWEIAALPEPESAVPLLEQLVRAR